MQHRPLGLSGLTLGALGLGTMNFGSDWHGSGALDEKAARRLVDLAADAGVNYLDTADIYGYGAAESLLGKILRGRRARFLIGTKVLGRMKPGDPASGGLSPRHIRAGLDASLRRLRTDYVDLYMPHDTDPEVPLESSLEAFDRAVAAGKVRALGCSNFLAREWGRCLNWARAFGKPRFEFNEVQLSFAAPEAEADLAGFCAREEVCALAWSPLGGGLLSGKYRGGRARTPGRRKDPATAFPYFDEARLAGPLSLLEKVAALEGVSMAQAALGWVLGKPWVACAVVGARSPEQLAETLRARPLSPKAAGLLDRAAAALARRT